MLKKGSCCTIAQHDHIIIERVKNKPHGLLTEEHQKTIKLHIASSIAYPLEIVTVVLVTVVVKLKQHCRLSIIVGWNQGKESMSMQ